MSFLKFKRIVYAIIWLIVIMNEALTGPIFVLLLFLTLMFCTRDPENGS